MLAQRLATLYPISSTPDPLPLPSTLSSQLTSDFRRRSIGVAAPLEHQVELIQPDVFAWVQLQTVSVRQLALV